MRRLGEGLVALWLLAAPGAALAVSGYTHMKYEPLGWSPRAPVVAVRVTTVGPGPTDGPEVKQRDVWLLGVDGHVVSRRFALENNWKDHGPLDTQATVDTELAALGMAPLSADHAPLPTCMAPVPTWTGAMLYCSPDGRVVLAVDTTFGVNEGFFSASEKSKDAPKPLSAFRLFEKQADGRFVLLDPNLPQLLQPNVVPLVAGGGLVAAAAVIWWVASRRKAG
jgi:hypothetical protein